MAEASSSTDGLLERAMRMLLAFLMLSMTSDGTELAEKVGSGSDSTGDGSEASGASFDSSVGSVDTSVGASVGSVAEASVGSVETGAGSLGDEEFKLGSTYALGVEYSRLPRLGTASAVESSDDVGFCWLVSGIFTFLFLLYYHNRFYKSISPLYFFNKIRYNEVKLLIFNVRKK